LETVDIWVVHITQPHTAKKEKMKKFEFDRTETFDQMFAQIPQTIRFWE